MNTPKHLPLVGNICTNGAVGTKIVKCVELVHDCILSKQQRNEMNRRYCDAIGSGMKALTARHLPCSQLHSIQATTE